MRIVWARTAQKVLFQLSCGEYFKQYLPFVSAFPQLPSGNRSSHNGKAQKKQSLVFKPIFSQSLAMRSQLVSSERKMALAHQAFKWWCLSRLSRVNRVIPGGCPWRCPAGPQAIFSSWSLYSLTPCSCSLSFFSSQLWWKGCLMRPEPLPNTLLFPSPCLFFCHWLPAPLPPCLLPMVLPTPHCNPHPPPQPLPPAQPRECDWACHVFEENHLSTVMYVNGSALESSAAVTAPFVSPACTLTLSAVRPWNYILPLNILLGNEFSWVNCSSLQMCIGLGQLVFKFLFIVHFLMATKCVYIVQGEKKRILLQGDRLQILSDCIWILQCN